MDLMVTIKELTLALMVVPLETLVAMRTSTNTSMMVARLSCPLIM